MYASNVYFTLKSLIALRFCVKFLDPLLNFKSEPCTAHAGIDCFPHKVRSSYIHVLLFTFFCSCDVKEDVTCVFRKR